MASIRIINCITLFLFISSTQAGEYDQALDKARDAFLVQSGIKKQIKLGQRYVNKEAFKLIDDLGLIEESGVVLGSYYIYSKKQVTIKFQGKRITLTPNSISVTTGF